MFQTIHKPRHGLWRRQTTAGSVQGQQLRGKLWVAVPVQTDKPHHPGRIPAAHRRHAAYRRRSVPPEAWPHQHRCRLHLCARPVKYSDHCCPFYLERHSCRMFYARFKNDCALLMEQFNAAKPLINFRVELATDAFPWPAWSRLQGLKPTHCVIHMTHTGKKKMLLFVDTAAFIQNSLHCFHWYRISGTRSPDPICIFV